MNPLWNLPVQKFENRYEVLRDILTEHFVDRRIEIVEIGVLRAGLIKAVYNSNLNVVAYTGVDPYSADETDPYLGSYWNNKEEADAVFTSANAAFSRFGQTLYRESSKVFFNRLPKDKRFDVVFVDGNHRYDLALWDMDNWFQVIREGGLMIVDDYANVDTPDVTKAINEFVRRQQQNILRMGYRTIEFQNQGKKIPIVLSFVYFEPVPGKQGNTDSALHRTIFSRLKKHI